jgi:hypothetical protein
VTNLIVSRTLAFLLVSAVVTAGSGCFRRASSSDVSTPVLNAPYVARPSARTGIGRQLPADDAAEVVGIPILSAVNLPDKARELRISDGYSMIGGTPVAVLRMVEIPGRPPTGQWLWVWTERREWPRRYRATRCSSWVNDVRSCGWSTGGAEFDWSVIAAEFDRLGVWSLQRPCEADGWHVSDGGELLIQRLESSDFEVYECNAPARRSGSPAGRAALAAYEYFESLGRQVGGPPPA